MQTIEALKNNKLFDGFSDSELANLANHARNKTYLKNAFIIKEGDNTQEMYLIIAGKVDVMLNNQDGDELILTTLQEGEIFGELSLLDDKPRSANIIARDNCQLLVIQKADFFEVLTNNSCAAVHVIKYLCDKLRTTNNIAYSYALMDVYERLIRYLLSVAEPLGDGRFIISLALTHKEIAAKICTRREVVSRMISRLEKDNYLSTKNKTITINKKLLSTL